MRMGDLGQDFSVSSGDPLAFLGLSSDATASDVTSANVAATPDPTSVAINDALAYPQVSPDSSFLTSLLQPSQPTNVTVAANVPPSTSDASMLNQIVQVGSTLFKYVAQMNAQGQTVYVPQPVSPMQGILSNPIALIGIGLALFLILK